MFTEFFCLRYFSKAAMQRDRIWSDVYVDHELDSLNGEDDLPLELPLVPLFCGFCPMAAGAQNPMLTWQGQ